MPVRKGRVYSFDDITRDDLLELAKKNNIKESKEIIDHISTVASSWDGLARNCGVPDKMIEAIAPQFQLMHWNCFYMRGAGGCARASRGSEGEESHLLSRTWQSHQRK